MEEVKSKISLDDVEGEERGAPIAIIGIVRESHDEKALIRKIDRRILPLMFTAYMLQFLDKTALGYTAIFGLQESLNLVNDQFSWASSAFYFGYLVASYPVSLCFVKFPLGKFLSLTFIAWAVVVACHGAASNFAGLMVLRVFLGALESTISPGLSLVTGLWYKRSEHASRHGVWFAGNSISSIFGGLLAYGIGHIHNSVDPWRWIFIIFGIITFAFGVVFFVFLPDGPSTAQFLSEDEREYVHQRAQQETHTTVSHEWSKGQCFEAVIDPKTWLLFVYTTASCIPNGGLTSFASIIIAGFGYSTFHTLLLQIPTAVFTFIWVVLSTIITSRVRKSRCLTIAGLQLLSLAGALMVSQIDTRQQVARLAGLWFFAAFSAGIPITLSFIASNVAGYTKKTTVSAIIFIGYCTGNIIGPFLFFPDEAPAYNSAWLGIMICTAIAIVSIIALRLVCDFQNRLRDHQQNVKLDPETREMPDSDDIAILNRDQTDWENQRFRYYL
ncbi:hypothetical protein BDV12DRAFT_38850 [Aspergillus spectabilis]